MKTLLCLLLGISCTTTEANPESLPQNSSAVILQYHHVSQDTPASTSVSPKQLEQHLDWLEKEGFLFLPLGSLVTHLQKKQPFEKDKVVAMTFDDANSSVCRQAWPILKRRNVPFTVFVSTEPMEEQFKTQCSWQELKIMMESGLVTIGNHSHKHLSMVNRFHERDEGEWEKQMKMEISLPQQLIRKNLGITPVFFAYPYGEYNKALEKLVDEAGLVGFGQHSGAVGFDSDLLALPRFPASGRFAELETLSTKLNSLAFPASVKTSVENPISVNSEDNPPVMELELKRNLKSVSCFEASSGRPIQVKREGMSLEVSSSSPLDVGRSRYNCTSPSEIGERFYWISYQWLVE